MKNLILAVFVMLNISSCNIFGESEIDNDFIFSLPKDNLIAWFQAGDSSEITFIGDDVEYWHNKVEGGPEIYCNADEPTYHSNVRNGLGAVYFYQAAPTCSVTHGAGADVTLFIAMQTLPTSASYTIFGDFKVDTASTTAGHNPDICVTPDLYFGPIVATFRMSDTNDVVNFLNGDFQCSMGPAGTLAANANVGVVVPIGTMLYEIILYDRLLSDREREAVENYLMMRWDIE